MDIRELARKREIESHQKRLARIDEILSDQDQCLAAELAVVEQMRKKAQLREEQRHTLMKNEINSDCDAQIELIQNRYLSKADQLTEISNNSQKDNKATTSDNDEVSKILEGQQ